MFIRYNNERVYHHPNPVIRFIENLRVKNLLSLLSPISPADAVLAAGCGEGYVEKHLKCRYLAMVDISREAIKRARKNKYPAVKISFHTTDLEKLPFAAKTFDKIECSEVIEHVYSPKQLLTELSRVAKTDGSLVISFPNEPLINFIKRIFIYLGIFNLIFPNVPKDMTQEWHLHSFSLAKFKHLCRHTWSVSQIRPVPFWFFPVRYVILCHKTPSSR
jgi:ubiquinone/menaquinone biosynthesis C-methylase UbiE